MNIRFTTAALAAAFFLCSSASAQLPAVPGWIADIPRTGYSYNGPAWFRTGDAEATFVAGFVSGEDRVVLSVEQNGRLLAQSSSCTSDALRARFGTNATCVRVRHPGGDGRVELRARPLVGAPESNLRASFYNIRPSGEEQRLADQRDVLARPVDFRDASFNLSDAEGARELHGVQMPGGVTSSMLWVESAIFYFFGGTSIRIPVLEAVSSVRFAGARDEMVSETSYGASGFSKPVVWAAARRSDDLRTGPLRVVRNDEDDNDGDGLGRALERAIQTCDLREDSALFHTGGGLAGFRFRACSQLATTDGSPTPARLKDTDQDGLTDAHEVLGRSEAFATLPRWGSHPHRKDLFVEVDYYDGDQDMRNGCSQVTSLWTQYFWSGSVRRPSRELIVEDFRSEPLVRCSPESTSLCPAGGGNWDFSTGVEIHLDLGPAPAGVVVDPADTRFGDFGGGNCVLHQRRLLTRECLMGGSPEGGCFRPMHYTDARVIHQQSVRHDWMHYMIAGQWGGQTSGSEASGFGARQRGTFQHELGHQLGLSHHGPNGAGSPYNDKINYISRMNYRYQDSGVSGGALLFSPGRLGALDLSRIDECLPFGALDLSSTYDLTGGQLSVCDRTRASCVSTPRYADVDWDLDGTIGGGTGSGVCPSADANRAAQSVLGASVRETGLGTYHVGHAARGTAILHSDAILSAPSMALREQQLLYGFVDSMQRIRVGVGQALTDANCPRDAQQLGCGMPQEPLPVTTSAGAAIVARHVALLELRARRETLMVYQPLTGSLRWGLLTPRGTTSFVLTGGGTVSSASALERVSLAVDPASGTVVALIWPGPGEPVVEARFTPGSSTWAVSTPSVLETLPSETPEGEEPVGYVPWIARGSIGLAPYRFSREDSMGLVAAYVDGAGTIRFVRRESASSYSVPERAQRPRLFGAWANNHIVLATNPVAERLHVVWTTDDEYPQWQSYVSGNTVADGAGSLHNVWTRQYAPAAFLWDDRSRVVSSALDGMRMALTARAPCDRCSTGFYSDNSYRGSHTGPACVTNYCQDDLDSPLSDGGFVQTSQLWMPLFEASSARAVLVDHNDYPPFFREICAWVGHREGEPERCAPYRVPAALSIPADPLEVHPFQP